MTKTVLWLCNGPVEKTADAREGTVFTAMARMLVESHKIRMAAVIQDRVKKVSLRNSQSINQLVMPFKQLGWNGLPSHEQIDAIREFVEKMNPDVIHVWGTENYWGLLRARGIIRGPTVLEIAGFKYVCADVYYGGLSPFELVPHLGPLDILRPTKSIIFGKSRFQRWGKFEKEMILNYEYISTQSNFVRMHVKALNPDAIIFKTGIMLREEFYNAQPWSFQKSHNLNNPCVFAISAIPLPYKGLHILIEAVNILMKKYPKISLNIAGDIMKKGIRRNCYARLLHAKACKLGLSNNIHFLGPLDANNIIQQFYKSSVVVIPSFVETYSLVLAEAMYIGVPVVASYTGAMPELARDEGSALFFPAGDEVSCAKQIERILEDDNLAHCLSEKERQIGHERNNPHTVVEQQLGIYNKIFERTRTTS